MIYSRFRGDGGYDYYETAERRGLGDDLPTPRLPSVSPIGVPSTEAGRLIPSGAKYVGRGEFARGLVAPLDRSGLSGLGALGSVNIVLLTGILAVPAAVGYWVKGKKGAVIGASAGAALLVLYAHG